MSEMLIDGAKLDACLDAEADAIRAKTGGSSDIPFDFANNKGFADAIAAIPSGGGESTPFLVSVDEYIHAEDWLSDALGNCLNFSQTYLDYNNHPDNFKIAYIENNGASNYAASVLWNYPTGSAATSGGGCFKNSYPNRTIVSVASFWITAGAKITVLTLSPIKRDSSMGV